MGRHHHVVVADPVLHVEFLSFSELLTKVICEIQAEATARVGARL